MNSFSILAWNIRQGGGNRKIEIFKKLTTLRSDVIVLSEFRNNASGAAIRSALLRSGYIHQFCGHAAAKTNIAAIFSRYPCHFKAHREADPNYPAAIVEAIFPAFRLLGVYLPHKKKHHLFPYLLEQTKGDYACIIMGDFNSGRQFIDQKGDSFWYSEYFDLFEKEDQVDAFRHVNGDAKTFSWYSHNGNGYRYDHCISDQTLLPLIQDCDYLHPWREQGISDHSPMLLTLGQSKPIDANK